MSIRPYQGDDTSSRESLLSIAAVAQAAGAEFHSVPGQDVAETLLDYAQAQCYKLIVRKSARLAIHTLPVATGEDLRRRKWV